MKNLAEGNNTRGAMKSTSKVLAWALSVMLIVIGITPTLAVEDKAPKQVDEKVVVPDSTSKKPENSIKEMNRKAGKVKNKRGATCNLNESGNVKAVVDDDKNITVTATDTSGDMKIERDKWIDMVVALGGSYDPDPGINKTPIKEDTKAC